MTTKVMNFKTDEKLKEQFDQIANRMGINSSALLNIFVKRVVTENKLPFELTAEPAKEQQLADFYAKHAVDAAQYHFTPDGTLVISKDAPENLKDWALNG